MSIDDGTEPTSGGWLWPVDSTDYERQVARLLEAMELSAANVRVTHQELVQGLDGFYLVDSTVRFDLFGVEFLVLVECKLHRTPIKRKDVQALNATMQSVGANKGILVASTGYQRGAIEYARAHRIALVRWLGETLHFKIEILEGCARPGTILKQAEIVPTDSRAGQGYSPPQHSTLLYSLAPAA